MYLRPQTAPAAGLSLHPLVSRNFPLELRILKLAEGVGNDPTRAFRPGLGLANRHNSYLSPFLTLVGAVGIEPTSFGLKGRCKIHLLLHAQKILVGAAGFEPTTPCPPDKCAAKLRHAPTITRWTISGILLSTIIRLALTLPPRSLPGTRRLPGTINTTYFRLLHLRCRPFHPDLTGSSLLPSLTFRWEGVTLQAVPCSPDFPLT